MEATLSTKRLTSEAGPVADLLHALANENRLLILCRIAEAGEANVGSLGEAVGLSQSAISQHLAVMRNQGLVTFRRERQTVLYRIADRRIGSLLAFLQSTFCQPRSRGGTNRKDDVNGTA
jgi:ArsR family transcriptional regulator